MLPKPEKMKNLCFKSRVSGQIHRIALSLSFQASIFFDQHHRSPRCQSRHNRSSPPARVQSPCHFLHSQSMQTAAKTLLTNFHVYRVGLSTELPPIPDLRGETYSNQIPGHRCSVASLGSLAGWSELWSGADWSGGNWRHTKTLQTCKPPSMLCLLRLSLLRDSCKIGTFRRIVGLDHFDLIKVSALLDAQVCSST